MCKGRANASITVPLRVVGKASSQSEQTPIVKSNIAAKAGMFEIRLKVEATVNRTGSSFRMLPF